MFALKTKQSYELMVSIQPQKHEKYFTLLLIENENDVQFDINTCVFD